MDSSHKFLKVLSEKAGRALMACRVKILPSQEKLGWLELFSVFSFPWDPAWLPSLISVQGPDRL